jgi:hypothetical protein
MPEFVMEGIVQAAREESEFVLGFIECLFFTNCESSVDSADWFKKATQRRMAEGYISSLPGDVGYTDLHPDSLASIRAFCEAWQAENAALLSMAYDCDGYDAQRAGNDLFYTMNGHGVGFWDRDALKADLYRLPDGLTLDGDSDHLGCAGSLGELLSEAAGNVETWADYIKPRGKPAAVYVGGI